MILGRTERTVSSFRNERRRQSAPPLKLYIEFGLLRFFFSRRVGFFIFRYFLLLFLYLFRSNVTVSLSISYCSSNLVYFNDDIDDFRRFFAERKVCFDNVLRKVLAG